MIKVLMLDKYFKCNYKMWWVNKDSKMFIILVILKIENDGIWIILY